MLDTQSGTTFLCYLHVPVKQNTHVSVHEGCGQFVILTSKSEHIAQWRSDYVLVTSQVGGALTCLYMVAK